MKRKTINEMFSRPATQEGKVHELKTWPEVYAATNSGRKTFEYRLNDREFQEGDFLQLNEWDPIKKEATGSFCLVLVTYVLRGPDFGVQAGYCCMSIVKIGTMI